MCVTWSDHNILWTLLLYNIYIYILNMLKFSSDNFGSKMWARERVGSSLNIPLSSNISHEKYKRKKYKERALT